jgi:hypothetical protein
MKHFSSIFIKLATVLFVSLALTATSVYSQCTPQGDQTSYGTNDTWIGYIYTGMNFDSYKGFVNEGVAGNPNFDERFTGDYVDYATNGCPVYTQTFSARYKLTKTFANANYVFTVSGDDGFRLSLDGGATWAINSWADHGYTTVAYSVNLNGATDMVLEYYENGGENRLTFNVTAGSAPCVATGDPAAYGSNNTWIGYVYKGTNFDTYKGYVTEGNSSSLNFDESFGGDNTSYLTSGCPVNTEQFSVRYRLRQNFANGTYSFTVGGDDGYRLSLDGGATWVINNYTAHSYTTTSYSTMLNGSKDVVLEYFENNGANRISISSSFAPLATLPIKLISWSAVLNGDKAQLQWKTGTSLNFSHFLVQRSNDGASFQNISTVSYPYANGQTERSFSYKDSYSITSNTFYRLAMVDIDGKTEYSSIIRLSAGGAAITETKLYPTVVENGSIFIESPKEVSNARM